MAILRNIRDVITLRTSLRKLRTDLVHIMGSNKDILTGDIFDEDKKYTGNRYPTYTGAVAEIAKKYNSRSDWGCILTGNIIDLRATFIISQGITVVPRKGIKKDEVLKELEWANDFLEFNDLDKEVAQEYAKEAEIEGKIALTLKTRKLTEGEFKGYTQMMSARYLSWTQKKYKVVPAEDDPLDYETLVWKPTNATKEETLSRSQFVYKKFGGRVNDPNEAQPKIMKCLTEIENVTMALRDWREINRLFAGPTPHIQCESAEQVKKMNLIIDKINFKIKKFLAHTGTFGYASPDMAGAESLEKEILRLVTFISGTTGVPIHWLGLTELLKQRATADDLREMVNVGTTKERQTWEGAYQELITKAMLKTNDESQSGEGVGKLDPWKIRVTIPTISREQWLHIEKVLMPLALAGKLSDEALISQVPGIDAQDELKKLEENKTSDFERIKADNDRLTQEISDRNRETNLVTGGNQDEED